MPRKPKALPDHFTAEEAQALVAAAPGYPTRMAMRIMLRTGLRVSECLSLRPADLRLYHDSRSAWMADRRLSPFLPRLILDIVINHADHPSRPIRYLMS